jgi:hypothetical protein
MIRSAVATLVATGIFHTATRRSRALTSGFVWLRFEWIPDEDQSVDGAFGDLGADLRSPPTGPLR